jgi:hypothetical protein
MTYSLSSKCSLMTDCRNSKHGMNPTRVCSRDMVCDLLHSFALTVYSYNNMQIWTNHNSSAKFVSSLSRPSVSSMLGTIYHIQRSQTPSRWTSRRLKNGPSMVRADFLDLYVILTHLITVIRAGLLWAKLSQTTQSLHVTRATARTFEREQWEALEKRLVGWKSGLAGVLEVVANARTQGGHGQSANVA